MYCVSKYKSHEMLTDSRTTWPGRKLNLLNHSAGQTNHKFSNTRMLRSNWNDSMIKSRLFKISFDPGFCPAEYIFDHFSEKKAKWEGRVSGDLHSSPKSTKEMDPESLNNKDRWARTQTYQ